LPGAKAHGYANAQGGSDAVPFFDDTVPPDPEAAAGGFDRAEGEGPDVDPFADLGLPDAAAKPRGPAEPGPGNLVAVRAAESVKPFD
ncbi:hypothetical protein, partial [Serratia marcescens]